MKRLCALLAVLALPLIGASVPAQAVPPPAPVRTLTVSGTGVQQFPSFATGISRYAAVTTAATAGTLQVTATTDDPNGHVLVDGRPTTGPTVIDGLTTGDEISVIIEDSAGTDAYAVLYLPAGYPVLAATGGADVQPGLIGLTLTTFGTPAGAPSFEAIVDRQGVPTWVAPTAATTIDLKRQPDGEITVSRPTTLPGKTGTSLVTLGADLSETGRYDTVGLTNTDSHDGERLADGSTVLTGYEPNAVTGKTDATIQTLDAQGVPVFTWTSAAYADETAAGSNPDYAHINSIQTVGTHHDILASFRHFSSVFLIATEAHDGHLPGDVIWKLGGRDSTFDFVDDPHGGPCAQHTASMLPDGHVLVFDNGGSTIFGTAPLCIDQADPNGPTIERPQTRAAEYALDFSTPTPTATLVWSYEPIGRYAFFAGSARRMPNGDTLLGWASERRYLATEVDAAGDNLWELSVPDQTASSGYVTYRAEMLGDVPDVTDPVISSSMPTGTPSYQVGQQVTADYSCTDRGGSTLQTCTAPASPGGLLDTATPGVHAFTITATDGAGNPTSVQRPYVVRPYTRGVDSAVQLTGTTTWTGTGRTGSTVGQTVRATVRTRTGRVAGTVLVTNTGNGPDTIGVLGYGSTRAFTVRYYAGTSDVTQRVLAGTYRTPTLLPGGTARLRVVIIRTTSARPGDQRDVLVRSTSASVGSAVDRVALLVTARR